MSRRQEWLAQSRTHSEVTQSLIDVPTVRGVSAHAQARAWEHYGILFSPAAWDRAVSDIAAGRTMVVRRSADGAVVHAVSMCGETGRVFVLAVVDPIDATVVTVLPRLAAQRSMPRRDRTPRLRYGPRPHQKEARWQRAAFSGETE